MIEPIFEKTLLIVPRDCGQRYHARRESVFPQVLGLKSPSKIDQ
jgi:hypothetical protein